VSVKRQPGVKEFCAKCSAYLHCCLNCRFRDPALHNECAIPNTEWVGDRKGANFCDEFEFADTSPGTGSSDAKQDKARQAFEGLFGATAPKPKTLDDLFKK